MKEWNLPVLCRKLYNSVDKKIKKNLCSYPAICQRLELILSFLIANALWESWWKDSVYVLFEFHLFLKLICWYLPQKIVFAIPSVNILCDM